MEGGRGGRGARSYDGKKAGSSINKSVLSDLKNIFKIVISVLCNA